MTHAEPFLSQAIPFLASLVILYIGYRLGTRREKRREHNEVAEPLQRMDGAHFCTGFRGCVGDSAIQAFRDRCGRFERARFDKALAEYRRTYKKSIGYTDPVTGEALITPTATKKDVEAALKRLKDTCKRK